LRIATSNVFLLIDLSDFCGLATVIALVDDCFSDSLVSCDFVAFFSFDATVLPDLSLLFALFMSDCFFGLLASVDFAFLTVVFSSSSVSDADPSD
jgi:hypothetical protein